MVMEATDFRHRNHLATVRRMDRARFRTIHGERQMSAIMVVIGDIGVQHALEVLLVLHNKMI